MEKKSLIESAAKLISQQKTEMSEMKQSFSQEKTIRGLTSREHEQHFNNALRARDRAVKDNDMVTAEKEHKTAQKHADAHRDITEPGSFGRLNHLLGKSPSKKKNAYKDHMMKYSTESKGNPLAESAAKYMSNQSEMGDRLIYANESTDSDLADIKKQHTDAVAEIGRHRVNHANWARAASPTSQRSNPHSDKLHKAIQKARDYRAAYKTAGGDESDLSRDQAEG